MEIVPLKFYRCFVNNERTAGEALGIDAVELEFNNQKTVVKIAIIIHRLSISVCLFSYLSLSV
jgi:hypothetical protein